MKKVIFKVPNGKLLRISIEESGDKISMIKINGDFFAYPEENIKKLEDYLIGADLEKNSLMMRTGEFESKFKTAFFGVNFESLIEAILSAKEPLKNYV